MVFLKAIGCYLVASFILLALSVLFMGGAFISYLPFASIFVAVVIYRSLFKVRYMSETE